jgi:hypothetical protein
VFLGACAGLLSACAGLTELQSSVSQLDQSVHTVVTAETRFLDSVQAADCDSQFYSKVFAFAQNPDDNFQLSSYCKPQVITAAQVTLRLKMLNALALYADKLQALSSANDDKQLTTNSQTLATSLKSAVSSGEVKQQLPAKLTPDIVAGVESAFTAIAEMALAQDKYKGITSAAKAMKPPIDALVLGLQKEDEIFSETVIGQHETLEAQLRAVASMPTIQSTAAPDNSAPECTLRAVVAQPSALPTAKRGKPVPEAPLCTLVSQNESVTNRFMAVIRARDILATSTGLTTTQLATIDWSSQDLAKPISDALSLVGKANDAIATGAPANISATAHDLYSRAEAARDLYQSGATSK